MTQGYDFRIHAEQRLTETLANALSDLGTLAPSPAHILTMEFCDSFDWRLYRHGIGVRREKQGNVDTLIYRDLTRPQGTLELKVDRCPRFPVELPEGPLRRKLAGALNIRALIARATLRNRRRLYRLLDEENKTTARLYRERLSQTGSGNVLSLLRVEPLRGYEKTAESLVRRLVRLSALSPLGSPWEIEVYRWSGLKPGDYESKLKLTLQPRMRSDAALRVLMKALTTTLDLNTEGMRQAIDTEFLHDYRVAVRRIRSALGQLKALVPRTPGDRFRREFAWLGSVTGPARDLDVYVLNFDYYLSLLPAPLHADLEPLRTSLLERRKHAYIDLNRHLDSGRYRRLLAAWRRYLAKPLPARSRLPDAERSIKATADERIWRVYRKVIRRGHKIDDQSPPVELHHLRIRCKRLRYLLEFFRSLYPKRRIDRAIKALKELQDVLGQFQDLEIQQHALHGFGEQMSTRYPTRHPTGIALAALVARLETRQREVRACFAERFQLFSAPQRRDDFAALFHRPAASDS